MQSLLGSAVLGRWAFLMSEVPLYQQLIPHVVQTLLGSAADGTSLGGVPREQKMLKGHLPRVIYNQVY